ncbi:MAG: GerMN domain-containing protein [Clostridia bacterium]|nr:GerMN domain-containing protein [Clostridia bacterium]
MKGRFVRAVCLLCACALLTGCAAQESALAPQITLPPVQDGRAAPENDAKQTYEQTVMLYLPSLDGTQLMAVPQTATLSASRHSARTLCEMLLSHPGNDVTVPVGGAIPLSLSETDAVEVSGQVATVSLAASALRLTHEQLFTVGQALANTLCQFGDLQYVNVLISGAQPGMNIAATLPAGSFQRNNREDLGTLWARASAPLSNSRRSFAATLYFPAPSGKGVLCEARTLSFAFQDLSSMALTMLDALSSGADYLPGVPKCPEFRSLLREPPTVEDTGGVRRLVLRFTDKLNSALIDAGITRSVMMASMVFTLTTFLPGIEGIEVRIGDERINSLTPSGTYSGAGEIITFQDGLMRRRDFSGFLLSECVLYFADAEGKLRQVNRPVPFYEANSARALVEQLMLGPQSFDSRTGLSAVLPKDLRPADLLGVAYEDSVLLLNFSPQFISLSEEFGPDEEKRMIYALVNTLCELSGVKRVAFYVQGKQPETLAGTVYLPGDFLPNLDLLAD